MTISKKKLTGKEFDDAFEKGDVSDYLDLKTIKVRYPVQRINIDLPQEIIEKVDHEASRIGVPRTSLLKLWIAEKSDSLNMKKVAS